VSTCTDLIRRRAAGIVERLQSHPVGDVGISSVTLAELEYGEVLALDPATLPKVLAQRLPQSVVLGRASEGQKPDPEGSRGLLGLNSNTRSEHEGGDQAKGPKQACDGHRSNCFAAVCLAAVAAAVTPASSPHAGRARGVRGFGSPVFERRYADGRPERLAPLAADLIRLEPDLLVTRGGPATLAAKQATTTIPIVMRNTTDPVSIGAVASLARPGGNVTGLTDDAGPEIFGKRVQFLKEMVPTVSLVANLTRVAPSDPSAVLAGYEAMYRNQAKAMGVEIRIVRLRDPDDIDKTFAAIREERIGALDVSHVPVTWANRWRILDLASRYRMPAMYHHRQYALDGGLMAYGEDEREIPRRLATYIDKLLRGAKPADLPVEQPTKFDLLINLKTAKALNPTIPPSLRLRAETIDP
jgi:putative ABC transport system substrate-binding protein